MSDSIKHECGIALVKLKKPADYYLKKYNTPFYGLDKLHLLMQKQRNRGQDGAGIAAINASKNNANKYISRLRSLAFDPITDIFTQVYKHVTKQVEKDQEWLNNNFDFNSNLFLGHLRYNTFGKSDINYCHPITRESTNKAKNLVVAGNFNLTNINVLFNLKSNASQNSDTSLILQKIGKHLNEEVDNLFQKYGVLGKSDKEVEALISEKISVQKILTQATLGFDGGYNLAGLIGNGDAFVIRDPNGIRPAFYYDNEEVLIVASERPAIQTALNVNVHAIKEITPGCALIIKNNGEVKEVEITPQKEKKSCSFERIYFSRGNDLDIYTERKKLGELLTPLVLKEINNDLKNTVFSFIPNTAEVSFFGLTSELNTHLNTQKSKQIKEANPSDYEKIISQNLRIEKVATKDVSLRTFIAQDTIREELVTNVYDITYESLKKHKDTLVIIDDSIIRGTTLKHSIIKILDRLQPKKIIVLSSSPQIRYPDCYGIDMSKFGDFIAFQALIALIKENKQTYILKGVYNKCLAQENTPKEKVVNHVKELYGLYTTEQISGKISQLITTPEIKAEVKIIYQTIENLHIACPNHQGDWYFTGDYPTPGGYKVANRAFINYMQGKNKRAY